jgi:Sec-independent protein translocase protein TatA
MPPEVKAAYAEIAGGVRSLGKAITEIKRDLGKAERRIEADSRARIRTLRADARTQLGSLRSHEREVTRTLESLAVAAGDSWRVVKQSADSMLAEARDTAASVVERFRRALGS